jgi:hypothetical protein
MSEWLLARDARTEASFLFNITEKKGIIGFFRIKNVARLFAPKKKGFEAL